MRDTTETAGAGTDKYYLDDRERWESLGFDWQGWNATIAKILQSQQTADAAAPAEGSQARNSRPE